MMIWNVCMSMYVCIQTYVDLYLCDIFGVDHIWLQSDAAFVYPRLD